MNLAGNPSQPVLGLTISQEFRELQAYAEVSQRLLELVERLVGLVQTPGERGRIEQASAAGTSIVLTLEPGDRLRDLLPAFRAVKADFLGIEVAHAGKVVTGDEVSQ